MIPEKRWPDYYIEIKRIKQDVKKILCLLLEETFIERNTNHFFLMKKIISMVTATKNPVAGLPFQIIFLGKIIIRRICLCLYVPTSRIISFRICWCFCASNTMTSGGSKSVASILLVLNFVLYLVITVIASWAVNHGIQRSSETASMLSIPARIFPIYFPIGNMATGFLIIFSLIAGVVGITTSLTGLHNVSQWNASNLHAAAASSFTTWALTVLALGFACKEIDLGWTDANLRSLEIITVIVTATQMLCTGIIHVGASQVSGTIY